MPWKRIIFSHKNQFVPARVWPSPPSTCHQLFAGFSISRSQQIDIIWMFVAAGDIIIHTSGPKWLLASDLGLAEPSWLVHNGTEDIRSCKLTQNEVSGHRQPSRFSTTERLME